MVADCDAPPIGMNVGASFTAVTVIEADSMAELNAEVPPVDDVLILLPAVPVD